MTDMTYEELRCALEVATENRRVLAQAVLDFCEETEDVIVEIDDPMRAQSMHSRMLSLAQELVK
jgi:hypothetical protein